MPTRASAPLPGRGPPRRRAGDAAEEAVARHLADRGWRILERNVRVGRLELDIVALEPAPLARPATLVIVEVRSRSAPGFGAPEESVDAAKVRRLYTATASLLACGRLPGGPPLAHGTWRIDLITAIRDGPASPWQVVRHLRGLAPP